MARKPSAQIPLEALNIVFDDFDLRPKIRDGRLHSTILVRRDALSHHYPGALPHRQTQLSRIVKHSFPETSGDTSPQLIASKTPQAIANPPRPTRIRRGPNTAHSAALSFREQRGIKAYTKTPKTFTSETSSFGANESSPSYPPSRPVICLFGYPTHDSRRTQNRFEQLPILPKTRQGRNRP